MLRARGTHGALVIRRCKSKKISLRWTNLSGTFFRFLPIFLRGHVVMMVMVKMVKIEMEKKEKCSIIYNIYIFIYYSIKMALPKIDFDQNDHDHFDHDTGAVQPHRNLDSGEKCVTWCQARCYMGEITRAQICALVKNLLSAEWMVMGIGTTLLQCHTLAGSLSVCLCVILSVCCDKVA